MSVIPTNGLARSDEQASNYFHHYFEQWEALNSAVEVDKQLDPAAPVEFMVLAARCWRDLALAQGRRYREAIQETEQGTERLVALGLGAKQV